MPALCKSGIREDEFSERWAFGQSIDKCGNPLFESLERTIDKVPKEFSIEFFVISESSEIVFEEYFLGRIHSDFFWVDFVDESSLFFIKWNFSKEGIIQCVISHLFTEKFRQGSENIFDFFWHIPRFEPSK
jgi:hypothetical protein